MRLVLIVVALGCVSRTAPADGWLQKDEGGVTVDSALVYEQYSASDRWCVGIGRTTGMDAGLHVGVDAKFDEPVRIGHNSSLANLTVATGYGAQSHPVALNVSRHADTPSTGEPAFIANDFRDDGSTAMVVRKRRGTGGAIHAKRSGGTEATVMVTTAPSELDPAQPPDGQSLHLHHRGTGIGVTIQNDYQGCQDINGQWIDCTVNGDPNPDVVSRPTGELGEFRDAGINTMFDVGKLACGTVFGVTKEDHPDDNEGHAFFALDNKSANASFVNAYDSTTGKIYFRLSKTAARFGSGVGVMISASDSPSEPSEALHVQGGNFLVENGDVIVDGYVKLGRVYSEPPAADCDQQGEIGRQAWDGEDKTLWMCAADYSWVAMQLQ